MTKTFLDYLTQANPPTIVCNEGSGYSTKTQTNYGPDDCIIWEDITWDNLETTFESILKQPMRKPAVCDAHDVPPEKTEIFEEDSVTQLVVAWNEPVLRHAFEGTHNAMCEASPHRAFRHGRIHFEKNSGRGHLKSPNGRKQMPDWCVYQRVEGLGPYYPNIVPGDTKPASKWKSEWVESGDPTLKKKARCVMVQITKYMWEAKTRYGFILSEEELVPVRLSVFPRKKISAQTGSKGIRNKSHVEMTGSFFEEEEEGEGEDDDDGDETSNDDTDRASNPASAASFADDTRKTGLQVEYCRIPWAASGRRVLTVNLALWWLPVLAVQENTIKQSGTYTSLGESERGKSPSFQLDQTERDMLDKVYGEEAHRRKRKAEHDLPDTSESSPSPETDERSKRTGVSKGRRPRIMSRSSSRLYQYATKRPPKEQSSSSHYSTPRGLRRSKRTGGPSEAHYGRDESPRETDEFVHSFRSDL